jgi:hypothetical protein
MSRINSPEDRPDAWDDFEDFGGPRRGASRGCECFAPGEVAGSCPGRENCPIARAGDDEEAAEPEADDGE